MRVCVCVRVCLCLVSCELEFARLCIVASASVRECACVRGCASVCVRSSVRAFVFSRWRV